MLWWLEHLAWTTMRGFLYGILKKEGNIMRVAYNPQEEKTDEEQLVKNMDVKGLPLCDKCFMHHNGDCF